MVTSDPAANRDAAIHVAHALSVHPMERELDFMTVVDDLKSEDPDSDSGAAGVFDMELASGVYYGYAVVDVALLISNLSAQPEVAAKVVEHLVHLIADVSPGAKKGSTAPYAYAEWMLVEAGNRQPRTLANAFRKAIPLRGDDIGERSVRAIASHLQRIDAAYGEAESRRQLCVLDADVPGIPRVGIDALAAFAADQIRAGSQ
jgi:CRISPR system Cascade subunit CasC